MWLMGANTLSDGFDVHTGGPGEGDENDEGKGRERKGNEGK